MKGAVFVLGGALVIAHGTACNEVAETVSSGGSGGGGVETVTTTTTTTTGSGGATSCPSKNFLDVSQFAGAGANYPKPELSVTCAGDVVTVTSNGIPHYEFVATTPNDLKEQAFTWTFPRAPKVAATTTEVPLLGTAGMAVNGMPIYGPNEAQMPDPYGDPVYNGIIDDCLGHTGGQGDYHYHALLVKCLTAKSEDVKPSPIVGYALDGFPILGPFECADKDCTTPVEMRSSWEKTGGPTTYAWDNHACTKATCDKPEGVYLDRCNGHVGPSGDCHDHATLAKNEPTYTGFPYILGCYRGTPSSQRGDERMRSSSCRSIGPRFRSPLPSHGRSPFRSCGSLRPGWSPLGGTCTRKVAPMLGAHKRRGPAHRLMGVVRRNAR
ncbi:MAG: YHYH protein [Deltaproteobacteria bacterium]|nr:YHYH protein [Deltaproteobacteria bacterium]